MLILARGLQAEELFHEMAEADGFTPDDITDGKIVFEVRHAHANFGLHVFVEHIKMSFPVIT